MDNKTFTKNLEKLGETIFKMAFWLLRDTQLAKDIVQETYLRLWEHRLKYSTYTNLKQVALKISSNLCIDQDRRNKRWLFENATEELSASSDNPLQKLEHKDTEKIITQTLENLPESQKTVMYLRGIEQLSTKEIASVMSLSENNVRVTLSRARLAISVAIKKWNNE